jgi:hypothetical protein
MFRPDTKRIAWFLGLRALLRFPRHFMAPSVTARRGRGVASITYDPPPLGSAAIRDGRISSVRPSLMLASTRFVPWRVTSRGAHSVTERVVPISTGLVPEPTRHRIRGQASDHRTAAASQNEERQAPAGPKVVPESDVSSPRMSYQSIIAASARPSEFRDSFAPASAALRLPEPNSLEREPYPNARPTALDAGATFGGQDYGLRSEVDASKQSPAGDQSARADRDRGVGNGQTQRNRSTLSTIHIDGSALGRWAVQHLERTLAKPSAGMTGVDPRAATPRSRVAPF